MATAIARRWKPEFPERWRHGGWYTNNRYDNGASGCVHNNHIECPGKRWFVVGSEDELGGFSTRTEAAYAERCMILEDRLAEITSEANAKLIAAAPDLLEAVCKLQMVCEEVTRGKYPQDVIDWAQSILDASRAAIAKATK